MPKWGPDSPLAGSNFSSDPSVPKMPFSFRSPTLSETPILIVFRAVSGQFSKWLQKCQKLLSQKELLSDVCSEGERGCKIALLFLQILDFAFLLLSSCEAAETPYFVLFSVSARFIFFATLWNAQIPNLPSFCAIPNIWAKIVQQKHGHRVVNSVCVCF